MTLTEYLFQHRITSKKFAKQLGVSLSTVNKWRIRDRKRPRDDAMIAKIAKITGGKVTVIDWYPTKKDK